MYTTLPHDKINDQLSKLIKWCYNREGKIYICTSESKGFFSATEYKSYKSWTCSDLCSALSFLLDNIYVRFGENLYKQVVGIPMGTNCAPLVADLFLYTYEKEFIQNLQKQRKHDDVKCFTGTSRYLDDILTIDNPVFEKYKDVIYPQELTLNKANFTDTETPFLDLNIKIVNGEIHTSVYDKRDDFGFNIVNFPWLDGDVPRLPSYGIYISQLIREMGVKKVKLVIVGDEACGKSSILSMFSENRFPEELTSKVFDTYEKRVIIGGKKIDLAMWDTAGREDYNRLRSLSYPNTDIVLMCFSIDNPVTLKNVPKVWSPEIAQSCPNVPFILVGNKLDVRKDRKALFQLKKWNRRPVSSQDGQDVAKQIGACKYMECSAKMNDGIGEIFEEAIRIVLALKKSGCIIL
ncbi:hypothetical protein FSP39_003538 [Pinctada imbricata]|uniref:Reverse transcriptase domain-containing protein n=1 Tax=Pinctada imbricata TaxID=66713 RepID=A0AA88XPP8_PINIB|nr:hypothetical protein FSP39_003538 [Pinctada imbricata]